MVKPIPPKKPRLKICFQCTFSVKAVMPSFTAAQAKRNIPVIFTGYKAKRLKEIELLNPPKIFDKPIPVSNTPAFAKAKTGITKQVTNLCNMCSNRFTGL